MTAYVCRTWGPDSARASDPSSNPWPAARFAGVRFAFLAIVFLLFSAGSAFSAPPPGAAGMPYGEGVLWQIERDGAAPSYLFGTIHLNDEEILDLPAAAKEAFGKARTAAFELLSDEATVKRLRAAALYRSGDTLDGLLGPELYSDVVDAAEPYGLNLHQVRVIKPWALIFMLNRPPSVQQAEEKGRPILDAWLYQQAVERGLATVALESVDQHIGVFDDLPEKAQRQLLRSLVQARGTDLTEIERRHAEQVRLYLEGKIGTFLEQARQDENPDNAEINALLWQRLFDQRNLLMVERMAPLLQGGGAFVAVGAGHLPGEEGMLQLLVERGYKVRRLH